MSISLPSLEDLGANFLNANMIEGRSPKAISWYRATCCNGSAAGRQRVLPDATVADIGLPQARASVQYLQTGVRRWEDKATIHDTKGLSAVTVRGYVRTIKVFWGWIEDESLRVINPLVRLKQPRALRKIIDTFTKEQIAAMLDSLALDWPRSLVRRRLISEHTAAQRWETDLSELSAAVLSRWHKDHACGGYEASPTLLLRPRCLPPPR